VYLWLEQVRINMNHHVPINNYYRILYDSQGQTFQSAPIYDLAEAEQLAEIHALATYHKNVRVVKEIVSRQEIKKVG
jgi:hypothetical protein